MPENLHQSDGRKAQANPVSAITAKYANKQKQAKEKLSLREKEVTIEGKVFVITKWKNMETLARVPQFMSMWFSHLAAIGTEAGIQDEKDALSFMDANTDSGAYVIKFIQDLDRDQYFEDYVVGFLNNVKRKDTGLPINIDEDLDSPISIIQLFMEVAKANFMMQLSQTIFSLPTDLTAMTMPNAGQKGSNE